MGRLVCFTGIDGAGKTTVAKGVVARLVEEGIPTRYVYTRYVPMALRPVQWAGNRILLRGPSMEEDYEDYRDRKAEVVQRSSVAGTAYRLALMADYLPQILWKVRRAMRGGHLVVCDRYVHDTLITDLGVDYGFTTERIVEELRRAYRIVPEPAATIYVDVPPDVAMSRKDDVPDVGYLTDRYANYRDLAAAMHFPILDGTQPKERVLDEAVAVLKKEVLT